MKEFLIFAMSVTGVAVLFIWINFIMLRRSFMAMVGMIMIIITGIVSILTFGVATLGLIHLLWALPVGIVSVMASLFFMIREVKKPFRAVVEFVKRITRGDLEHKIEEEHLNRKDELGRTFRVFDEYLKRLKHIAQYATSIGKGNLDVELKLAGENDVFGAALLQMKDNLSSFVDETQRVVHTAGREGHLQARIVTGSKQGVWKEMAEGVNELLSSIQGPLIILNRIIVSLADGNISQRFVEDARGDIHELKNNLNEALDNIEELLGQVKDLANTLSDSSEEMMTSGHEMSTNTEEISSAIAEMTHGAQTQVSKVDEASTLIEAVLHSSREMSSKAETINQAASEGAEGSQEGQRLIEDVVSGMGQISSYSSKTGNSIKVLTERSDEITAASNIIQDIAAQTNLLALNAAIEAAQAGEAGRGFAVVAEEIRKLAEDARKSVKTIDTLIEDIRKDTVEASKAMSEMDRSVEKGLKTSRSASETFLKIYQSSQKTLQESEEILSASRKQIEAMNNVVSITESVVVIAEQTAAGTEEVASSSSEMSAGMKVYLEKSGYLREISEDLRHKTGNFVLRTHKTEVESPEEAEEEQIINP